MGTTNGKLNDDATVFQAESIAMEKGIELLENAEPNQPVTILTDSQALLQALRNRTTNSHTVYGTKQALNGEGKQREIRVRWIKAHVNHYGNELADALAKDGALGLGSNDPIKVKTASKRTNLTMGTLKVKELNQKWK